MENKLVLTVITDVAKISNNMFKKTEYLTTDPFWENGERLLISAALAYMLTEFSEEDRTLSNLRNLVNMAVIDGEQEISDSKFATMIEDLKNKKPEHMGITYFEGVRMTSPRTYRAIVASAVSRIDTLIAA